MRRGTPARRAAWAALAGWWVVGAGAAYAQAPASPSEKKEDLSAEQQAAQKAFDQTLQNLGLVTVEWVEKPLPDALQELGKKAGVNIVLGNLVTADLTVTLSLNAVPFRVALNTLLDKTGLIVEEDTPDLIRVDKPPRVFMEFSNAPLTEVVKLLAKQANANIIIGEGVQAKVSLILNNVPWKEALQAVVKTANYAIVEEGFHILRVVRPEDVQKQMENRIFVLKFLRPPAEYTAKITTPFADKLGGTSTSSASSGSSSGGGTATMSTEEIAKVFPLLRFLQNMLSKDLAKKDGKPLGTLEFYPDKNAISATDTKPILDQMESVIARLDQEPEQVIIDLKFITTRNEDLLEFGTRYSSPGGDSGATFSTRALPQNSMVDVGGVRRTGEVTRLPFGIGSQVPKGDQFFLTTYEFAATLRLFKEDTYTKTTQAPSITALNNRPATIFVGDEIHYAQVKTAATQSGGTTSEVSEVTPPINVGFQLFVLPNVIAGTNKIQMTVIPKNEFLSGTNPAASVPGFERITILNGGALSFIDLPQIRRATVVTNMMLESGTTAVIGGLAVERNSTTEEKIPFLGNIPIIDILFKHRIDRVTKEHILIFITPRIVQPANITRQDLSAVLEKRAKTDELRFDSIRERGSERELQRLLDERREGEEKEFDKLKAGAKKGEEGR